VTLQTKPRAAEAQKKRRNSASGIVADHIVKLINRGRLRPGDRLLSEHGLMQLLNVGRSSVREAVRGLVMAGILESRQKRGTVVVSSVPNGFSQAVARSVAYWAIRDMEEVRMLLECFAVARAAEVASEQQIAELEHARDQVERKIAAGSSYLGENTQFHLAIARIAHNSALTYCLSSIIENFKEARSHITWSPSMPANDLLDHRAIVDAIRRHDPNDARRLMEIHLGRNLVRLDRPEGVDSESTDEG